MDGWSQREIASFIEGKRRSVEVKERDQSCQTKLDGAEHRNLSSKHFGKNVMKIL